MEKTCKTCKENDCGLCDRTGRLVEDDFWPRCGVCREISETGN